MPDEKELKYKSTADIKVPKKIFEQVIGQEEALKIIKKASLQRRHVLLIGEPGTGKCSGKNTIIPTSEGDFRAEDIYKILYKNNEEVEREDGFYLKPSKNIDLFTINKAGKIEKEQIIAAYKSKEKKKCLKITSRSGAEIILSGEHPILSVEKGVFVFKKAEQLIKGTVIGMARSLPLLNKEEIVIKPTKTTEVIDNKQDYLIKYKNNNGISCINLSLPKKMNKDLAYMLGVYVAEGDYSGVVNFSNKDKRIKERIKEIAIKNLSYPKELIIDTEEKLAFKRGRTFGAILELAFDQKVWDYEKRKKLEKQSGKKRIPKIVMCGKENIIRAFLAGYIDGDGHFDKQGLEVSSASKELINDLRLLLLKLGIISRTTKKLKYASNTEKKTRREYYYLTVSGNENLVKLKKDLHLLKEYKKNRLEELSFKKGNTNVDLLFESQELLKELKDNIIINYKNYKTHNQNFNRFARGVQVPSREYIQRLVTEINKELYKMKGLRFNLVKYEKYSEYIKEGIKNFYKNLEENKKYFSERSFQRYRKGEVQPSLNMVCKVNNIKNKSKEFYQLFKKAGELMNLNSKAGKSFENKLLKTTMISMEQSETMLDEFCKKITQIEFILKKLEIISDSDIFLDKIKKIEFVEEDTYDFEVKNTHNFIVGNGIIIHNSLLGQALVEELPPNKLVDVLSFPNEQDENNPLIRVMPRNKGKELVNKLRIQGFASSKNMNILFFILLIASLVTPWWIRKQYGDILAAASLIGSMILLASFIFFFSINRRMAPQQKIKIPKLLVDSSEYKTSPFIDASGAKSGALLGDVLHDPLQTFSPLHSSYLNNKKSKLDKIVNRILKENELIKKDNYIFTYTKPKKYFTFGYNNKIEENNEILSVNKYKFKGSLIKLITESGKELIVTPEHKVAVKGLFNKINYIRADKIKSRHRLITLN